MEPAPANTRAAPTARVPQADCSDSDDRDDRQEQVVEALVERQTLVACASSSSPMPKVARVRGEVQVSDFHHKDVDMQDRGERRRTPNRR